MSFDKLNLKRDILDVLTSLGYKESFEVQEKIIPLIQQNKNVVFNSKTGSGKTLAYLLGFLGKINKKQGLQMIVLVPTRELCIQVGKEMKKICEALEINVGVLYGGRDIKGDNKTLCKKNQIMIGTPGRLLDHVDRKTLKVGEVKCLVYDESDQMFDQGFYDECVYLKERISKSAQIVLSSATTTKKVQKFLNEEIQDYEFLQIGDLIPKNIIQEKLYCEMIEKNDILVQLLSKKSFKRALVFCNTKQKSYDIAEFLEKCNFNVKSLNSNLTQEERNDRLNLFKDGKIKILITTDVAARGLHIESVDIVVNYDAPTKDEFYVHRIGRTGRVDAKGYSITFICPEDINRFANIEVLYDLDTKEIEKNSFENVFKKK